MLTTDRSVTAEIKLYYDTFVPKDAGLPAPLLIAVHGYGAHKIYMMREARLIAPENFVLASIQGPNQFYSKNKNGEYKVTFGWLTDHRSDESIALHHKFVNDVIDQLASNGTVDAENIYLFGFSQACALNFRYAFTFPEKLKGVIGVCGGIPSDIDTNPRYDATNADVLYLYGDDDEFYTNEQFAAYDEKLRDFLPNYSSIKYSAGHEITTEMREDMRKWLEKPR
ncbi:MAG: dienelactone hydrolase family protein [Pyrinomonadaceae bacterium]|nr:dienelactone hydrolase family protein [Pyrinomonadaceae bacterium]